MDPQTHSIRLHDSESVGGSLGSCGNGDGRLVPTKARHYPTDTRSRAARVGYGPRPSTAGGTCEYVGFTIRLHYRLVCQEPTGETQPLAGATLFDG
jgi:hypothetical protein